MLGPFSIDTYLPAFTGIAQSIGATPVQMQQTLSAYLFGFAVMNLFHGALSDSFGRRPVVLWRRWRVHARVGRLRAVAAHRRAGVLPRAAGHVGRRRHRRLARRHPRHVPARRRAARDVAGDDLLRRRAGGRADGRRLPVRACRLARDLLVPRPRSASSLFVANCRLLPETLHATHRAAVQRAQPAARLLGARRRARASSLLALASGIPFNGMFLYVLSAPVFLGEHLGTGAGRVLLVLHADDRRHHGRRLAVGAAGRARSGRSARSATASLIMVSVSLANLGAQPRCSRRTPGGRCCRSRCSRSAGR